MKRIRKSILMVLFASVCVVPAALKPSSAAQYSAGVSSLIGAGLSTLGLIASMASKEAFSCEDEFLASQARAQYSVYAGLLILAAGAAYLCVPKIIKGIYQKELPATESSLPMPDYVSSLKDISGGTVAEGRVLRFNNAVSVRPYECPGVETMDKPVVAAQNNTKRVLPLIPVEGVRRSRRLSVTK